ncbi:cell wall metabolism sensor histidine kinase WalK [Myxococcus llanfairpwllgwyngyllgogerychwyrndrobwllllantysiliogogogochensis]|uniref:histidine kinase n=1 Tax=Myxococcus llanfairpwllgwyngyllgogerychwyrndrobwllllantysiliogogogochensis TaxID=2590453 RepID=A0A540X4T9_9BACT|nr:HAMP domain-containing sensor histidine kinase [Myxococcus llanfairpwllgwyngyllgogerychwyrndrobwllllantysiliogogogochensis]NTX05644.1 HAMP domain-containing protein [Myxococcus sp. CA040A]NTX10270.1 HAMP domain-containing protein [Myxococcus sp. CA056]NTX53168.1 HAMP domain-containing protein [Myxococcus sp. CA039A]TQF16262.1 HAMP domain-containing protein [Myxococcus llanfairpwllgwyngyllgogerychwyrndrobwllllantysiliogogogochensis]
MSRLRTPGRLLLRIYLVGIAQLVLVVATLYIARFFILDKPLRHGFARNAAYNIREWEELLGDPVALQASLDRAARLLEARVTLRDVSGRLIATNSAAPSPALGPVELEQLAARGQRFSGGPPPHSLTLPIPEEGPVEAYATIITRPPEPPPGNTALVLGAVLLCTAITSLAFARTLAGPLQRLAEVARALGEGKLDTRTGIRRRDELGQVAEAFDEMAGRITNLLRSQKELLANVSHELRTPLARIRVALDLAEEGDAATAREMLTDITGDLSELERLVDDVLTTAKLDLASEGASTGTPHLRPEQVEIQGLVEKAASRFRSARPERVLEVSVDGTMPTLEADPVLLRRALDNLLDNAGKYSESPTPVRLRAQADTLGALSLEVCDEGIGIEPEDLSRVGTPFFRTDRSRARRTGGVGMGLALARRIVDAHGGTLTLESQPGVGTTARILLPVPYAESRIEG